MKKILIVNNNMKTGGVQKSLCNLLYYIADRYEVTLLLFEKRGALLSELPEKVRVISADSAYRFLGLSQGECGTPGEKLGRGALAGVARLFGRPAAVKLISLTQSTLPEHYDAAVSYLHNGTITSFYGGVNEFVLNHVSADRKLAFLHCDYQSCGGDHPANNRLYRGFDRIAACSQGCRAAFVSALPELADRCSVVCNLTIPERIWPQGRSASVSYQQGAYHGIYVGRLAHEKAVDRAIRATACVRKRGLPFVLHLIGDGPMRRELQNLAASEGIEDAVIFEGEQTNPYRYMPGADLLLLTSLHEAAPLVIDEAEVFGLPVLTVRTTSSKEMVEERGAGVVCGNSQEELNRALIGMLEQPERLRTLHRELMLRGAEDTRRRNEEALRQFEELLG